MHANNRHVELIVNGAVHDFGYILPSSSSTWTPPNTPVGITSIGADPFGGENFGGVIDDVRVYNRTLPAAEIAWLATGDR